MAVWDRITTRGRVEDRRGMAPMVGGVGLTGMALLVALNLLTGGNPLDLLYQLAQVAPTVDGENLEQYTGEDEYEVFASRVVGSADVMWQELFSQIPGKTYTPAKLVLFRTATESGCGMAASQVGPHYCSVDGTIYLDETFFDELKNRLGVRGGDVAEAYVIAHEMGHHAQSELGTLGEIQKLQQANPTRANSLSVGLELQADCYAGLWANAIGEMGVLNPGEIAEAMDAAAAVGDDRVQERVTGQINPETWTHGSSQQRVEWFDKGYESGSLEACQIR